MNENIASWYETRRNELLDILKEATALDLPERDAQELRQAMRKCQEDAFEIALVGEFGMGISTTFDAFCDGRYISPLGLGIKTSAAVVSAQNIVGDETKDGLAEWAEVEYKTSGEIALGLSTILRRPLLLSAEFRKLHAGLSDEEYSKTLVTDDGFPSLVNLDNPDCFAILLSTIDDLWKKWQDNRSSLSGDELDELQIATLQLRFYGTDEYRRMASRTVLPIDQFQKRIAFPTDWMIRWTADADSQFSLEEVAFVFVHKVLVRIHSENLRRLGCRITDCTGLFANPYDTAVAKRMIKNADAVWYLIDGSKCIGQKDLENIRTIAFIGLLGKIQVISNLRIGAHEHLINEVLSFTQSILKNQGYNVEVLPYNARLAFLAMQGQLLLMHPEKFSELDKANMVVDAKKFAGPDPAAMWSKMVRRMGFVSEVEALDGIEGLTEDTVSIVRSESLLDGILTRLETDIIPRKARRILMDKGIDCAARSLVAYEGVLKATEDAAQANEKEWRAKIEEARRKLSFFVERAQTLIDHSDFAVAKDDIARRMATDIVDSALNGEFIDTLATDVAVVLRTTGREFYMTRKDMEKALVAKLTPIMAEDFKDSLTRAIEEWKAHADNNFLHRLRRALDNVCAGIHDLWVDCQVDANEMFKGFSTPSVSADDVVGVCGDLPDVIIGKTNIGVIAEAVRRGIFSIIWDVPWPCETDKIFGKIRSEIEKTVSDSSFRNGIIRPLLNELVQSIQKVETILRSRLDDLKSDFEKERVEELEKYYSKSREERQRIASQIFEIRIGTIEPLRKRIEAFAQTVTKELAG